MKKTIIFTLSVITIIGLALGSFFIYITSTPEYALAKTIEDINSSGMNGLKPHLTENAAEKIASIEEWTVKTGMPDILISITKNKASSFVKSKITEMKWTVEDTLKGKNRTDVVIGFNYNEKIIGTIEITMIKDGLEWKIDRLSFPCFDKFSLWENP